MVTMYFNLLEMGKWRSAPKKKEKASMSIWELRRVKINVSVPHPSSRSSIVHGVDRDGSQCQRMFHV